MKLHQKLDQDMPHYKGRYSEEKCAILEKDVELLWKKVRVYEHYGDAERNLRHKAVDELNKVKEKTQNGESENVKLPDKEWKTVREESDGKNGEIRMGE